MRTFNGQSTSAVDNLPVKTRHDAIHAQQAQRVISRLIETEPLARPEALLTIACAITKS